MEQLHEVTFVGARATSIWTAPQWQDPSIFMLAMIAPHRRKHQRRSLACVVSRNLIHHPAAKSRLRPRRPFEVFRKS
jgi:hypothetical protein